MKLRKRMLPPGWYPDSKERILDMIRCWNKDVVISQKTGVAGVAPHAGWTFSGGIAASVFQYLKPDPDTVIIIGGHLPEGAGIYIALEDGFQTPLGNLQADRAMVEALQERMAVKPDLFEDNTVEIQLPLVKYFMPDAEIVWIRVEHSKTSIALGKMIKETADELEKSVVVIGSTDLTHYGPSYGFSTHGSGEKAVEWVKKTNDRIFIEAMVHLHLEEALDVSRINRSACSAGGAVAAGAFARGTGIEKGIVTAYGTSYDIHPSDSFVGYTGIVYSK